MSGSGQAPNVSMDELLSSIKSMIEGESNGGDNSAVSGAGVPSGGSVPDEGQGQPQNTLAALDEEIMDLTQVVKNTPAEDPMAAASSPPHDPMAELNVQQGEMPADMVAGDLGGNNPPEMPMGENPLEAPPVEMAGAEAAAAQLNDLLGGMSEAIQAEGQNGGAGDLNMGGAPAGEIPGEAMAGAELQAQPDPMADPMAMVDMQAGAEMDPMAAEFGAAADDMSAGGDLLAQNDMPMDDGVAQMAGELPAGDLGAADMAAADVAQLQGMHEQAQNLPPEAQLQAAPPVQQGQPPVDPQLMAQAPMGQPPMEQGQMGHPPQGQAPQGQPPMEHMQPPQGGMQGQSMPPIPGQPPMGGVPQGQPPQGMDPRMVSEAAMDQALTQAQVSLNTTPAQQQMQQGQQQQLPPAGGYAGQQGGLPVLSNGNQMVPVPDNTRQMQMMQPQYMPAPTTQQLPVEMRNNLEEIVKQLLKPLLREWLERNLPELLQGSIDPQTGKIDPDKL